MTVYIDAGQFPFTEQANTNVDPAETVAEGRRKPLQSLEDQHSLVIKSAEIVKYRRQVMREAYGVE